MTRLGAVRSAGSARPDPAGPAGTDPIRSAPTRATRSLRASRPTVHPSRRPARHSTVLRRTE